MKILKGSITTLAGEGRLCIQVPQYSIDFRPNAPSPETEDIPDDWIDLLKDRRHAIGKEEGFWYLSRKGYEANKKKLKAAFLASPYKRGTWEEFEVYVAKHFSEVEAADERFERGLATKLTLIRAIRNRT